MKPWSRRVLSVVVRSAARRIGWLISGGKREEEEKKEYLPQAYFLSSIEARCKHFAWKFAAKMGRIALQRI